MYIKILKNRQAAPDGKTVKLYRKDEIVKVPEEMPQDLAEVFIKEGWAEEVKEEKKKPKDQEESGDSQTGSSEKGKEEKDQGKADANKDAKKAPENKGK